MKKRIIYIVSSAIDPHVEQVIAIIKQQYTSITPVVIYTNRLSTADFLDFSPSSDIGFTLYHDNVAINIDRILSAWNRKPFLWLDSPPTSTIKQRLYINYKKKETATFTSNEFLLTLKKREIFIVNDPHTDYLSSYKLDQLSSAKKIGLAIPHSLVSTNKKNIMDFFKHCKQRVITKRISQGSISEKNKILSLFTREITEKEFNSFLKHTKQIDYAVFLQEKIEKKFDCVLPSSVKRCLPVPLTLNRPSWGLLTGVVKTRKKCPTRCINSLKK